MTNPSKTIGPLIADSAKISLSYAKRMLAGIAPEQFGRFARVGDQVITSNHPAFVYGHLSLYSSRVVEQLGGHATSIKPSDAYVALFGHTATCVDDPTGTIYPSMSEITERLLTGHQMAIDALLQADDALFTVPNANEAMRSKFATNGSMHAFYLGGHFMIHMGQVSAWRRMMGLGAA
ncbi:MAG: DinB family protein [Planctomycetaceae bacterium]